MLSQFAAITFHWIDHPETDAEDIGLLAGIARYADASGICRFSLAVIAKRLKRTAAWACQRLAKLAKLGAVKVTSRPGRASIIRLIRSETPDTLNVRESTLNVGEETLAESTKQDSSLCGGGFDINCNQIEDKPPDKPQPDSAQQEERIRVTPFWQPTPETRQWAESTYPTKDHVDIRRKMLAAYHDRRLTDAEINAILRVWIAREWETGDAPEIEGTAGSDDFEFGRRPRRPGGESRPGAAAVKAARDAANNDRAHACLERIMGRRAAASSP